MKTWDVSGHKDETWLKKLKEPELWKSGCEVKILGFETLPGRFQLDIVTAIAFWLPSHIYHAKLLDPKPLLDEIGHATTIDVRWPEYLFLEYNGKEFTDWHDLCQEINYHPRAKNRPK